MAVLNLKSIRDTQLWQRLNKGFKGDDLRLSTTLAGNLVTICDDELAPRMRSMPTLMPEYTLHDDVHCLRVSELMWRIIPERVRRELNPVEIALLILSAYFHDQGMVLESGDISSLQTEPDFQLFSENWEVEHPNVAAARYRLGDSSLSDDERARARQIEQELHGAMLTDHIRRTHAERSARLVRSKYATDKRLEIAGSSLAEFIAMLALSHVEPADGLTPDNGFRYDERIGTFGVNLAYLGVLLRLADILDFDRDRTPDSLYRTIDFRSGVSLREWNKHRSVEGWVIDQSTIQYTLRCTHPEYQRAAYQYMDWIDKEIAATRNILSNFPAAFSRYSLALPLHVDRSRIEPKDNAYIYNDLEFSLSRDEIVSLLMTEQLYGGPRLCVRELLQNALDALRHRKAVWRRDGADWTEGHVDFTHELDDDGFEILRCTDNGIGMSEDIIRRFLTRAGRSYYRSPEFEQERAAFRRVGADFDPCAQFGIGFMSCFMIGDHITITTRRDNGPRAGYGRPLRVEINGLGGMVVIRHGSPEQTPGTTIEVRSRTRPAFVDESSDRVKLVHMLDGYALATEFPIHGECTVPDIAGSTDIPASYATPITDLEYDCVPGIKTFEARFDNMPNLSGIIRASFITDTDGRLIIGDSRRSWRIRENHADYGRWRLFVDDKEINMLDESQTCADGILVAGNPGRADKQTDGRHLGMRVNPISLGRSTFLLDTRGNMKPALTPARTPPDRFARSSDGKDSWTRLNHAAATAWGEIWEQIASGIPRDLDDAKFWLLAEIYGGGIIDMRASELWKHVKVPVSSDGQVLSFIAFGDLGSMRVEPRKNGFAISTGHGIVGLLNSDATCGPLNAAIVASSYVALDDAVMTLHPSDIAASEARLRDKIFYEQFVGPSDVLRFAASAREYSAVARAGVRCLNEDHALVRTLLTLQVTKVQQFARAFLIFATSDANAGWLKGLEPPTTWMRRLGRMFLDINWSSMNESLRPPYKVHLNGESFTITTADLEKWAART